MNKPIDADKYGSEEGQDQVILDSGRVLFNAKSDFLMGFADKGVSFSTNGGFHINGGQGIDSLTHINTEKIYLGLNAESKGQPALMGDDTQKMIIDLIEILEAVINDYNTIISAIKWPNSGGPAIAPATLAKYPPKLILLKERDIKSKAVFLLKQKQNDINSSKING